jgi:hypothetical protein
MPYRSFYGHHVFTGAAWFFSFYVLWNKKAITFVLTCLCVFVILKQVFLLNQYIFSTYKAGEENERITHQLAHDIMREIMAIFRINNIFVAGITNMAQ